MPRHVGCVVSDADPLLSVAAKEWSMPIAASLAFDMGCEVNAMAIARSTDAAGQPGASSGRNRCEITEKRQQAAGYRAT